MNRERIDVVVAGGGSAGLAAALAAARSGARTLLVERHGMLGGMATAALVHSLCGLYLLRDEPEAELAHPGFPTEFARQLLAMGGAEGPHRFGRVDLLLTQPTAIATLADRLCAAEPRLEVALHTELISAHAQGQQIKQITEVELLCRGTRRTVEAASFVDATGDAALALLAGAATEQAPLLQRPAFIFSLGGVDTTQLGGDGRLRIAQRIVAGVREGALPKAVLGAQIRPSTTGCSGRVGEAFITLDLIDPPTPGNTGNEGATLPYDPASPACLSALERFGRELATTLTRYLRDNVEPFASAYIAAFPAQVGIRESRRVVGRSRIEAADILNGATFADAIALSTWPIELRESATGPRLRYPVENRPCEIPLGALMARDHSNLFMAGRCLSSSHEAQAALRVIGTCLATGEAAGLAAALFAEGAIPFEKQPDLPSLAAILRHRREERATHAPTDAQTP